MSDNSSEKKSGLTWTKIVEAILTAIVAALTALTTASCSAALNLL